MMTAKMIDHTLLKASATEAEVRGVLAEARKYKFASVCLNPRWVALAAAELKGSGVDVCTVIGFPLGANTEAVKVFETQDAIKNGATEIDMVISIGSVKSGDFAAVESEIRAVVEAAKGKAKVKVIIETCLLTDEEKVAVCEGAVRAGADFVKTSTGFSSGGATVEDVALMRRTVGGDVGVKASGGIRTREDFDRMVAAGANRVGASASIAICEAE